MSRYYWEYYIYGNTFACGINVYIHLLLMACEAFDRMTYPWSLHSINISCFGWDSIQTKAAHFLIVSADVSVVLLLKIKLSALKVHYNNKFGA